ncbi:MAG: ankyrin repeat domain-containing protein [Firmicutes bacterium]|nr:ankyrin repeat domain-containing protein [Bacillota bacterium]
MEAKPKKNYKKLLKWILITISISLISFFIWLSLLSPIGIIIAVYYGKIGIVKTILFINPQLINVKYKSFAPLCQAAYKGQKEILEILISKGADINAKDNDGHTALYWASEPYWTYEGRNESYEAYTEMAKLLISSGADVNVKDNLGYTPLEEASRWNKEIVELLISKGADINAKDKSGWTPLHIAAKCGHKDIAMLLISKGANVNAKDDEGYTPLHRAAEWGRKDIAMLLISKGANVNAKDKSGRTPLHIAANSDYYMSLYIATGKEGVVELLISAGADINVKDKWGNTPLESATGWNEEIVELLISKGADVNAKNKSGYTPLHLAVMPRMPREKIVSDPDAKERPYSIPARLKVVKLLISKGADVNAKNKSGYTPLHLAVMPQEKKVRFPDDRLRSYSIPAPIEVVELLISKGADVNIRANNGETPMQAALRVGRKDIAELLRKHGAKE